MQLENVHCNIASKTTYMTNSDTSDTIFFVASNDETGLLQTKEIRLENLKKVSLVYLLNFSLVGKFVTFSD